jgi:hypothetical protein
VPAIPGRDALAAPHGRGDSYRTACAACAVWMFNHIALQKVPTFKSFLKALNFISSITISADGNVWITSSRPCDGVSPHFFWGLYAHGLPS